MSCHMRLTHTTHVCYWRCPVPSCPLWFTSELNGKDHIENTHYCLHHNREPGLCWFFVAAVAALKSRYDAMTPLECVLPMPQMRSLIDSIREDIHQNSSIPDAYQSPVQDLSGGYRHCSGEATHTCQSKSAIPGD